MGKVNYEVLTKATLADRVQKLRDAYAAAKEAGQPATAPAYRYKTTQDRAAADAVLALLRQPWQDG